MSSNNLIDLKAIDGKTKQRSVVARILRLWVQKDKAEIFLLDAEGSKIQATIPNSLKSRMIPFLKEEEVIKITNFKVEDNSPTLQKAKINHRWKMSFSFATKVVKFDEGVNIKENFFEFTALRDVYSCDPQFVLDVLGEVKKHGNMEFVSNAGARKCDVTLVDSDGTELVCIL